MPPEVRTAGDSGGIPEETTASGVPCLMLRENTERPITVSQGTNLLVGADLTKYCQLQQQSSLEKGKTGLIPRFWDGHPLDFEVFAAICNDEIARRGDMDQAAQTLSAQRSDKLRPTPL
jgi:hypothetical protein